MGFFALGASVSWPPSTVLGLIVLYIYFLMEILDELSLRVLSFPATFFTWRELRTEARVVAAGYCLAFDGLVL